MGDKISSSHRTEFAKKNGVTEVIFLNNMSMLRNDLLIGMLGEIIG